MTKVHVLLVIATIIKLLAVINAYPFEEAVDSPKPSRVTPVLVADKQQKQNETTDTSSKSNDDDENDSSNSSNSTEPVYIEETYIEVLLPSIPQLNTTDLEALLNGTANSTDDNDRSKRNSDNEDSSSLDNVSPPASGSTVPPALYGLRYFNSTRDDKSSEESSDEAVSNSSTLAPSRQVRSLEKRNSPSSKSSEQEDISSPSRGLTNNNSKETLENKNNEESHKDLSATKAQPARSPAATPVLYSAQHFYSRPARGIPGSDDTHLNQKPSSGHSDNIGQKNDKTYSAAPALYSAHYSNVRKVREVVNSSEDESSSGTTQETVVYVTPRSKSLKGTNNIPEEATASASYSTA